MNQYTIITTPQKEAHNFHSRLQQTVEFTPEHRQTDGDIRVDYRAKTFKLMKELAQSEVLNKKNTTLIRHLQKEVENVQQCLQKMYEVLGAGNFDQACKRVTELNHLKVEEWTGLIEEYKKIINAQQYKFIRQEQQLKILQMKVKRFEHQNKQTPHSVEVQAFEQEANKSKLQLEQKEKEISTLQQELTSLNEELAILKTQFKQVLVEKQKYKDQYMDLHHKYNLEIEHFEQMEKHVEQRLLEVEREMNFYRDERQAHLEKIELLKKEIDYNQTKKYFSFGGVKHTDTQTDFEEDGPSYNYQCLEISIKTLLEENAKLKNTLLVLYTRKPEEQLPKEIQLQLKILLNMHESSFKPKTDQYQIEKYFQSQKRGCEKQLVPEKIDQAQQEQEEQKEEAKEPNHDAGDNQGTSCLQSQSKQRLVNDPSETAEHNDVNTYSHQ